MRYLILAALALATPAAAQQIALPGAARPKAMDTPGPVSRSAPVNGVLTLYGNERCPTDRDGNEVVVCQRRSAQEQFRVPKELREFQITPQNESWAAKAQGTLDTGVGTSSIGSCSTVGAGGQSRCFAQSVGRARAENKARSQAASRIP